MVFSFTIKKKTPSCKGDEAFKKGWEAEKKAQLFLEEQGYICLYHRYKTAYGEIDLVMERKSLLVFVEVKYRWDLSQGLLAFRQRQRNRVLQAAEAFLGNHSLSWEEIQCDIVVVTERDLFHIPHAFSQESP